MTVVKETIKVEGMSCAACQARIEKALGRDAGVRESYANFSANKVSVTYDDEETSRAEIVSIIEGAGYHVLGNGEQREDRSSEIRRSLITALVFSVPVVVLAMGPMFGMEIGIPPDVMAVTQLVLTIPVVIAGRRFFIRGIPALLAGSPTMDTLIALGSGTAFIYSAYLTAEVLLGHDAGHLYFESAAMIITLISVGKYIESRSRERTNDAVNGLRDLAPKEARVIRGGAEVTVPASELAVGDIIRVRPGERIFADALVTSGETSVDESNINCW